MKASEQCGHAFSVIASEYKVILYSLDRSTYQHVVGIISVQTQGVVSPIPTVIRSATGESQFVTAKIRL